MNTRRCTVNLGVGKVAWAAATDTRRRGPSKPVPDPEALTRVAVKDSPCYYWQPRLLSIKSGQLPDEGKGEPAW